MAKESRLTGALRAWFLTTLAAAGASHTAVWAQQSQRPQLVVGILVEGLSEADLSVYRDVLGSDGFERLESQGVTVDAVDYGDARGPAAVAIIATGATANVNGIASRYVYNRDTGRRLPVVHDPAFLGNFTTLTVSPGVIRVSTLPDEARMASGGYGRSYSIAADPETAVIAAGHAASSATWINDNDGRWATSTFYKDTPGALTRRNYQTPLASRLDTISWADFRQPGRFSYRFPRTDSDRFMRFKRSARVQQEITDLACDFMADLKALHRTGSTDFLTVAYNVSPSPYGLASPSVMQAEQEDSYRRLDNQIARLLNCIESTTGLANTVVYVAGIPAEPYVRPTDERTRGAIPAGEFSIRKAKALLNMYLMALHGNGEWVSGFDGTDIFLNSTLVSKSGVEMPQIRREAADFMRRMSGVTSAETSEQILAGNRSRYHTATSAPDVSFEITPGWTVTESEHSSEGLTYRALPSTAPFFLFYPSLKSQRITSPVDAVAIAPTLARTIRIRAPNAASATPLPLH